MTEQPTRSNSSSLAVLVPLVVSLLLAILLWPELEISRWDLNDNVFHRVLVERTVEAMEGEENPLDFWVSEWSFGYPVLRSYQPLGHLLAAGLYLLLGKSVSLVTLFAWLRYLLLVLFPLSVYGSARLLGLKPEEAAGAALVSPLLATNNLYGIEMGSFQWRGSGLFTQAWAMHLFLWAIAVGARWLRRGRGLGVAGVLLALCFLAHLIYGWMAALSLLLLLLVRDPESARSQRLVRLTLLAAVVFALTAFHLVPLLGDATTTINHSRWEPSWKWDSFGAWTVTRLLFSGNLLDFGRLPVLSLLALLGVLASGWRALGREEGADRWPASFVLLAGLWWLALFAGRATWGVLFQLLGAGPDVHLHRLLGGAHLFLILLVGIGLGALWQRLPRHAVAKAVVGLLVVVFLMPAILERINFARAGAVWGMTNLAAVDSEYDGVAEILELVKQRPGRSYAGLAAGWGSKFTTGQIPFYGFLSLAHEPALSFLYHSMALSGDLMVRFDESNPAHYRLFNVDSVIAAEEQPLPPFLAELRRSGRFRVSAAPGNGFFQLVSVPRWARVSKATFYELNDRWLQSHWVGKQQHLRLVMGAETPPELQRLARDQALPGIRKAAGLGEVLNEWRDRERYGCEVEVTTSSHLLFSMNYHPNWEIVVDGEVAKTVMLSPGFVGIPLTPGRHEVGCRYRSEWWKTALLGLWPLVLTAVMVVGRRRWIDRWVAGIAAGIDRFVERARDPRLRRACTAIGLLLLAFPVCAPLLTDRLPSGHDAFEYLPRQVEFHENIRHGVLLPQWAPDLSAGHGQPFFVFNPPLIYALAEVGRAVSIGPVTALNMACVLLVVVSACSMFLLGRRLFGCYGGWIAAAAYIYAPYFLVDLYVRRALAEFATFAFMPLALYGFIRFARGKPGGLVVGALGYAAVMASHHPAAFLFSPLLGLFVLWNAWLARSWRILATQVAGICLALGLGAIFWLPALAERELVHLDRLLEGYLSHANHFVAPWQLLWSPWGYGISVAGAGDGMSFSLGCSHLALVIAAGILLWSSSTEARERRSYLFFLSVLVLLGFFMFPASAWLWKHLPLLSFVEFPWRLLGPATVCVALLVASVGKRLEVGSRPRLALTGVLALLILPSLAHVGPQQFFEPELEDWTPNRIAERGVAVTTRREYEPIEVRESALYRSEPVEVVAGEAAAVMTKITPTHWKLKVEASTETLLELRLFSYPGWTATLDGLRISVRTAKPSGRMQVMFPSGLHHLELRFLRTRSRLVAGVISLISALILLILGPTFLTRVQKAGS